MYILLFVLPLMDSCGHFENEYLLSCQVESIHCAEALLQLLYPPSTVVEFSVLLT